MVTFQRKTAALSSSLAIVPVTFRTRLMLRLVPVPQCSVLHWSAFKHTEEADNGFCYIDKRVLVENKPLVKFTRNFIRDSSGEFSISSVVRISTTPFPAFTRFHFGNAAECCKLKRYKLVKPSDFINPLISLTSTKREDLRTRLGHPSPLDVGTRPTLRTDVFSVLLPYIIRN